MVRTDAAPVAVIAMLLVCVLATLLAGSARADGTLAVPDEEPFAMDGAVTALATNGVHTIVGGKFAHGDFAVVDGVQRLSGWAALRTADGTLTAWDPGYQGASVADLAVSPDGGTVSAGGSFWRPQGTFGVVSFNAQTGETSASMLPGD